MDGAVEYGDIQSIMISLMRANAKLDLLIELFFGDDEEEETDRDP